MGQEDVSSLLIGKGTKRSLKCGQARQRQGRCQTVTAANTVPVEAPWNGCRMGAHGTDENIKAVGEPGRQISVYAYSRVGRAGPEPGQRQLKEDWPRGRAKCREQTWGHTIFSPIVYGIALPSMLGRLTTLWSGCCPQPTDEDAATEEVNNHMAS